MIHLRGQGLIMTIRRIWAIEPPKKNYYETGGLISNNSEDSLEETSANLLEEKSEETRGNLAKKAE